MDRINQLEQGERLQATLWEQYTRNLAQFRQQVDQNLETFRIWATTWQRQTNEQLRHWASQDKVR